MSLKSSQDYYAFLLRLWQEEDGAPWRASLEDPGTGERKGFADIEQLINFLRAQTEFDEIKEKKDE